MSYWDFFISKVVRVVSGVAKGSPRAYRPKYKRLGESDSFLINYYDNGSDILFVVFNRTRSTKRSPAFGLDFLLAQGFSVVVCYQDNDTQYQSLSFERFRECVLPVTVGKRVFTYGSSLGAYAAVYYAGAVGATVIAAAPKNSAHPLLFSPRGRFSEELFKHEDLGSLGLTKNPVFVMVDPMRKQDIFFVKAYVVSSYPEAKVLELPFSGHACLKYLLEIGKLKSLVLSIVYDGEFPEVPVNVTCFVTSIEKALHHHRQGKPELALEYARTATRLAKSDSQKNKVKALYARLGQHDF
ncbi:hypothetical protein NAV11_07065 [Pseudomonas songnenensis]|uniref:hypothetical protein n=1 Tax=Pseudomonas songnenensis TaxID=1176259 RepID=UPI0011C3B5BB|nr:hypothetical protein [Pseudomonas songnenensis]MCQ4299671.1 hypothetical protein [Pseudomonas songnenensis]